MWAIYGARLGCQKTVLSDWETNLISDFDWFKGFFYDEVAVNFNENPDQKCKYSKLEWDKDQLYDGVCSLGRDLNDDINTMMLFDPDPKMCEFFKKTFVNPKRWGVMIREKQIQDLLEKGLIG